MTAGARVGLYFAALVAASALAYVPLAVAFTPWTWSDSGPFAIQLCRSLHYTIYFFAGIGVGAGGIDGGLLAVEGVLARRWAQWFPTAFASLMLWMGLTSLTLNGDASLSTLIAAALSYVFACAASCFFLIAASLRFGAKNSRTLGALAANAYGLYLLHYVFVVWLQYALLTAPVAAIIKAVIVFSLTLLLAWITIVVAKHALLGARFMGDTQAKLQQQAQAKMHYGARRIGGDP